MKKPVASFSLLAVMGMVAAVGLVFVFRTFAAGPSGVGVPNGDLNGWKLIFAEDFTKPAATGSMGGTCAEGADKIIYTGTTGTKWRAYPDCYLDTYQKYPYRSDQVLSVHDGMLDFYLHQVDGKPAGANPSPVISGTSQYQAYGRYSVRMRIDNKTMSDYYIAWLLWPQTEADWKCAESDFPEAGLTSATVNAFAHYGCNGSQDWSSKAVDMTQWHTYTQEWVPGVRRYYVDDVLVGTSTNMVYDKPQRWQLQTETKGAGTSSGHLYVDWAAVWSYSPGTVVPTPRTSMKLMPLGDSITEGWIHVPGAYRIKLHDSLVTKDKLNIDFVGSLQHGPTTLLDRDHEGHTGWRIDQLRANIDTYLNTYTPDTVLLHIGTNDVVQNYNMSTAPARLSDLASRICTVRPGVDLVVASIIPRPGLDSLVNTYNAAIPGIVTSLQGTGCKARFLDMNKVLTGADLDESLTHPTLAGYNKMADAWYPVVRSIYGVSATPTPTSTPLPGDLNADGKVNVFDLSVLIGKWGTNDAACDLNANGKVDVYDLSVLLSRWTG